MHKSNTTPPTTFGGSSANVYALSSLPRVHPLFARKPCHMMTPDLWSPLMQPRDHPLQLLAVWLLPNVEPFAARSIPPAAVAAAFTSSSSLNDLLDAEEVRAD